MPTSASTGTEAVQTAGKRGVTKAAKPAAKATEKDIEPKAHELSSPDGAPIVDDPDKLTAGDRVGYFEPRPAPTDDPQPLADPSGHGVVQVSRPDGTIVQVDASQDGWEQRCEDIRTGKVNI